MSSSTTTHQNPYAVAFNKQNSPAQKNMNIVFSLRNVQENASHTLPYLKPDSKILDIGCGIGTISQDFAQRCPQGSILGIDHNTESLDIAKEAASTLKLSNLKYETGDVMNLSGIPDNEFDIVHAHQVILHLSDPVGGLKEMCRVCKPSGIVAIRDNAELIWVNATPLMLQQKEETEKVMYGKDDAKRGGRLSHIWMNAAGFSWEDISMGSAGWEVDRVTWWKGAGETAGRFWQKITGGSEEDVERGRKEFEEWGAQPESRVMGLDGWVIGRKG
ncbi:putative methyltransferase C1B3.06c [Pseudocercospora fuligena]|uniref:Putative methyltransferase C1B3.06c n=1 Tax=Pseudocercospora fuligena TaxID=685502 RepID=A0A8H6RGR8_9PEZI|nr:putative methyltransferase C1B3.06c [Pseudocercospora fuligena]